MKRTSTEPAYVEATRLAEERRARERIGGIVRTEMAPNIDGDDEPTPVTVPTPPPVRYVIGLDWLREHVRKGGAQKADHLAILELADRLALVERILAPCSAASGPCRQHEWRIDGHHPRCRMCGVEVPR